jgi:Holliday junction resolvase RusA-like endonuclease
METVILYDEVFYITPQAQERPRTRMCIPKDGRKPFVIVYDPERSKKFKKELQKLIKRMTPLLDQPMIMECKIFIQRPKSVKRDYPSVKPDLSNYIKGVEDAMNGLVYTDDSKIIGYDSCMKLYTKLEPKIKVTLHSIG